MSTSTPKSDARSVREVKFQNSLGDLIRSRGLARQQKNIASDLGISEAALSHYIKGRSTPSFENLLRMADYFDVSLDYLVYGDTSALLMTGGEVDYVARQVQTALNQAQNISARKQDLVSRLAQVMIQSLDGAVEEIVAHPTSLEQSVTLSNNDAVLLEENALSVDVMSGWQSADPKIGRQSGTSITTPDGKTTPGPFLEVQANNLKRGISYRQIVQGPKNEWFERAGKVRSNLQSAGVAPELIVSMQNFKGNEQPIISTVVLLRISGVMQDQSAQIVFERFRGYFREDGLFAYISIMDDLFKGGLPLGGRYRDAAESIFDQLWKDGEPL